ncbi:MAG: glycosyltransferase, partial [Acidithiobacillus sp.]
VTVSTGPLKEFFDKLHPDVKIVSNYMPRHILESVPLSFERDDKPRIGWAGGLSHTGDLSFIKDVMDILGDAVHWVFMGMVPNGELNPDLYTQVPAKPCGTHVQAMAEMRLDLALAPLEHSDYNRCKSNLKILEYGACGFPVLATDIDPYSDAPIFFPKSGRAEDWAGAIRDLLADRDMLQRSGVELRNWVWRNFTLEEHLEDRMDAWGGFVPEDKDNIIVDVNGLILAQPNVIVPFDIAERIQDIVEQHPDIGTLSFWGNDNEFLSYPTPGNFTPLNEEIAHEMDRAAKATFGDAVEPIPFPVGQVIWVSPRAVAECGGMMDTNTPSAQWMEYGHRLRERGFTNYVAMGIFTATWLPTPRDEAMAKEDAQCLIMRHPALKDEVISIQESPTLANARGRLEATYLRCNYPIMPVRGEDFTTSYEHWSQTFGLDGPIGVENDAIIAVYTIGEEGPIVESRYFMFVNKDDEIDARPMLEALSETDNSPAILYGDEDTLQGEHRTNPYFKPDYNYELLLSHNYIGRGAAIRSDLVDKLPSNEMEYYDLIMKAIERSATENGGGLHNASVTHVPYVTIHRAPTPPPPSPIGLHLQRIGQAAAMTPHPTGFNMVQYAMPKDLPMVSIVIPTKNNAALLSRCIKSLEQTDYPNYEILVVDNGNTDKEAKRVLQAIQQRPKTRVLNVICVPFNYSTVNNRAVLQAKGDYVCLMNDDVEVKTPYWLNLMMRSAMQTDIGAVGAKLLYPNGTVQHTGVVTGMPLVADHKLKGIGQEDPGYFGQAICMHEVTAVTGACLLVNRDTWDEVGGLDERYAVAYGDVAFCLELRKKGYHNIIQPQAVLWHHESASRGMDDTPDKLKRHLSEAALLRSEHNLTDPFWNPNLALTPQPSLAWPPRVARNVDCDAGFLFINIAPEHRWPRLHAGISVFEAETESYSALKIVRPDQRNLPSLSVLGQASEWQRVLDDLGVTQVLVGGLVGVSPALLGMLDRLEAGGLDVFYMQNVYDKNDESAFCPRGDASTPEGPCGAKWKESDPSHCQACIDTHGSPYGYVNVSEWWSMWGCKLDRSASA